ncbi:proline-rich protein 2-like [Manis pentadactyla]|uniref:proline-rich protein 2-like n=1 Tax=Manis pentadactyla TaxID=143292 RepID=UPI00255CFFB8|nr:proline-rich protein 2-like [Manis pentadactyla]
MLLGSALRAVPTSQPPGGALAAPCVRYRHVARTLMPQAGDGSLLPRGGHSAAGCRGAPPLDEVPPSPPSVPPPRTSPRARPGTREVAPPIPRPQRLRPAPRRHAPPPPPRPRPRGPSGRLSSAAAPSRSPAFSLAVSAAGLGALPSGRAASVLRAFPPAPFAPVRCVSRLLRVSSGGVEAGVTHGGHLETRRAQGGGSCPRCWRAPRAPVGPQDRRPALPAVIQSLIFRLSAGKNVVHKPDVLADLEPEALRKLGPGCRARVREMGLLGNIYALCDLYLWLP